MSQKKDKKKKLAGADGFDQYYKNIYKNRWERLKKALLSENIYAEWKAGGKDSYFLDTGSVLAATILPLKGSKEILDLCAAPGGKSVILASLMDADAHLTSNERSVNRFQRLKQTCENCLPVEKIKNISLKCSDGAKWCRSKHEIFDSILLDVPCSSERHVLKNAVYLDKWYESRVKNIAFEQWSLLSSAYRMLKPEGFLLYSTCALNPTENDGNIEKLLKKFTNVNVVLQSDYWKNLIDITYKRFCNAELPEVEITKYGCIVLPDAQELAGPLYFSLVKKKT